MTASFVVADDLQNYTLYATNSLTIDDRAKVSGDGATMIGSAGTFTCNVEPKVWASIYSYGNVTLKDRSTITGNVFTHSTISRINNPVINGYYRENINVPVLAIPTCGISFGSVDKPVYSGTLVLPPGSYRDVTVYSGATLRLSSGEYHLRKFISYSGARIALDAPITGIDIRVASEVTLGDQSKILSSVNVDPRQVKWYSNQSTQITFGTLCTLSGTWTAPNCAIRIGARSILKGAVYAKSIYADPDVIIQSCNDTRYVDTDRDDVPDIVETAMGTNPSIATSTPKVAQPSAWYADPANDIVVHYDLSIFPKYFYHTDVPISIPAGVNTRAYNPVMSVIEADQIGVPTALPPGNTLLAAYEIKAGIASGSSLMFGFPLPGASLDLRYGDKTKYVLQHYNETTAAWETIPIAYINNNVAYASITSNQRFIISQNPLGLTTINDLRVFISDNPGTVLEEKNYADVLNDIIITDSLRLEKTRYSLDQFCAIMPQMSYRFVGDTTTGSTDRANLWLYWVDNADTLGYCSDYLPIEIPPNSNNWFPNQWIHGLSFFHDLWEDQPNFKKPGIAREDNTIYFNPANLHYTPHGTDFIAREEIYNEWNDRLARDVSRREFMDARFRDSSGNLLPGYDPETDVFHPAGNQLTGCDMTWVIRHELGHCLGLGDDNQHSSFLDPGIGSKNPGDCNQCNCMNATYVHAGNPVVGQCRQIIDEWEGLICYEDKFSLRDQHFNCNLMREFDARDLVAKTAFMVSYPYIRKFVRMQNRGGACYNTNNYYDVRYRMFETPFTINAANNNPERYFVVGFDSVMVTTAAGSMPGDVDGTGGVVRLQNPYGVCIDAATGDVYFGVHAKIKKMTAAGTVTTIAGTGVPGYSNGSVLTAQFDGSHVAPFCRDHSGNIYVCERNVNRIRKISATGMVTLFAGSETGAAGYADGTGSSALFNWPSSMCIDASGNLYVADYNNHRIRKVTPAGVVTTLAGTGVPGNSDGLFTFAKFNFPCGIAIAPNGNLYVADRVNIRIRELSMSTSVVGTFAGDGTSGHLDGPKNTASFVAISDLFVDHRNRLYVADDNMVRMVADGQVTTIAGLSGDAVSFRNGCGTDARFNGITDIGADLRGNIYVADEFNSTIRKISTCIPLVVNAPLMAARLEDAADEVFFEFTVTENMTHTISVVHDSLLTDLNATLYWSTNDSATDANGGDALISRTLDVGRYVLKVFGHAAAVHAQSAFSVAITNSRQTVSLPAAKGASVTVGGNLEREGDNDWFRIDVNAACTLTVATEGRSAGLAAAPVIYMYLNSEGLPVGGVPRVSTPAGVVAVPGVTEDEVHANLLIRRILRDGRSQISQIVFGTNRLPTNRVNILDTYWIRVRAGNPTEMGNYTLRVTRN